MKRKLGWWFSVFIGASCIRAVGQQTLQPDDSATLFERGNYELALSAGPMFSPIGANKGRPTLNYALSGAQCGWMLTDARGSSWLSGNLEVAAEAIGAGIFEGKGNYISGGTAWVRYNFVQPNWRLVPYAETGAGADGTDVDSRLVGGRFAFNLNVGAGTRYFVAKDWSINLEFLYQHISNATLYRNDLGINAIGPVLGVSYFF